jgi:outer membrane receptor for monomeric catechols
MDTSRATRLAPGLRQHAARARKHDRDSYVDSAAPYKADRLSSPRATEPILNIPGQTTFLTREVLDDMKATSLKDALRSTAGVTVGR